LIPSVGCWLIPPLDSDIFFEVVPFCDEIDKLDSLCI